MKEVRINVRHTMHETEFFLRLLVRYDELRSPEDGVKAIEEIDRAVEAMKVVRAEIVDEVTPRAIPQCMTHGQYTGGMCPECEFANVEELTVKRRLKAKRQAPTVPVARLLPVVAATSRR